MVGIKYYPKAKVGVYKLIGGEAILKVFSVIASY
jgi:hypothetical protein